MNILIVDDEAQIRRWFEALLVRTGLDLNLAGSCGNGKEALEFCRAHHVDIVITDIKMPIMNGLELIRSLAEERPATRTLILSSYDEFQYASEALKLGATEYMLKAEVTVEGLRDVIRKIESRMDTERQRKEEVHTLKSTLNESQYALRAVYMKELLKGLPAAIRDFNGKMDRFQISLKDKHVMLMAVSLDDYPNCLNEAKIKNASLLDLAVINILDDTIRSETGGGASFAYQENLYIILCNADRLNGRSIRERFIRCAHDLSNNLMDYLKVPASVGISEPHHDLTALNGQFRESIEAIRQKRFYGQRHIVWASDLRSGPLHEGPGKEYALIQDLAREVEAGSYDHALQTLEAYLGSGLQLQALSESKFKSFSLELIYTLLQLLRKIKQEGAQLDRYTSLALHEEISVLHTFEEVKRWLTGRVSDLLEEAKRIRPPYSEPIRQAFRYLDSNYSEELSLQQVADHVHLNKTYLSELFKKETGISFNDCLTGIRIEKAKERIRAGEGKMGALAEQVGYPNASYFTKVFKKSTGLTPLEFKNRSSRP